MAFDDEGDEIITDPDLLQELDYPPTRAADPVARAAPEPEDDIITDPALLEELNRPPQAAAPSPEEDIITDPKLLEELGQPPKAAEVPTEPTPGTKPPEAQSQWGAGVRKFIHGLPGALGGAAGGALVGGAAGGAGGNPLTVLGGAVVGGIAGGFIGESAKEAGLKLLGIADSEAAQLAVNAEAHPWTTAGADAATAVVGGTAGAVSKGARVLSGGIAGGFETGRQLYQGEELDPVKIAATTAGGAIFAKPYEWQNRLAARGGELGAKVRPAPEVAPPPPPPETPPASNSTPGPTASGGTAEAMVPPAKVGPSDTEIGNPQSRPEGSETAYLKPRDSATGDANGITVKTADDSVDEAVKVALGAENVKTQSEVPAEKTPTPPPAAEPPPPAAEPQPPAAAAPPPVAEAPQGVTAGPPVTPVAEAPQGRPPGEQPTPRDFWSYKAPEPPKVGELPEGAIKPGTTQAEFEQLSPGMRREIARSTAPEQTTPKPADDGLDIPDFLDRRPKPAGALDPETILAQEPRNVNLANQAADKRTAAAAIAARKPGETVGDVLKAEAMPADRPYRHADLSKGKLESLYKEASAESKRITDELIKAGRGNERPSETFKKTDQLSRDAKEISDWRQGIIEEVNRRKSGHGKLTPLPKDIRQTYGEPPRSDLKNLRQDVIERGRDGRPLHTAPLPIGKETAILEQGAKMATGEIPPTGPQPPEIQAAKRKAPTPEQARLAAGEKYQKALEDRLAGKIDDAALAKVRAAYDAAKAAAGQTAQSTATPAQAATPSAARGTASTVLPTGGGPTTPTPAAGAGAGAPPGGGPPPPAGTATPTPAPPAAPATPLRAASVKDLEEGVWPTIQRFFMPGSRSESGKAGLAAFREGQGTTEGVKQTALARFTNEMHQADNAYQRMPEVDQRKLANYAEGGTHLNTPGHALYDPAYRPPAAMQRVLDATKQGYADFKNVLQSLPKTSQMSFVQDYWPHMYQNPGQAQKFLDGWYGSGSGSLKGRTHPTLEDGIAAGLTPKNYSPIETFTRYATTMSDHVSNVKTVGKLHDEGWLFWGHPTTRGASGSPEPHIRNAPPDGFHPVKMPGSTRQRGPVQEQAYAPRDMAETLNNLYDAGLRRNATAKDVYEFALMTKNMWTAAELGLSPYHAFTMIGETLGTNVARSLEHLSTGNLKLAGTTLAKALTSPVTDYKHGRRAIDIYTGKVQGTPTEMAIDAAMKAANIKPVGLAHVQDYELASKLGSYATSYARGALKNEFAAVAKEIFGGNYKAGMMFLPNQVGRLMQTAMQPLFEFYIPAIKTANTSKGIADFIHANPTASQQQINAAARKIADSMDNRFGEMVKDNLSMNKAFKDGAFLAMRSFAFTIGGPVREVAGGLRSGVAGALKGENRMNMSSAAYDPRVAYAIAFPLVTGAMASITQYAMTGTWPTDWRDTVVPKTGGKVVSGKGQVDERVLLPGYHKDFLGWAYHPTQELFNKMAGPWQAMYEQISGRNYRDQPLLPPKATWPEQFKYRGGALLDRMTPIALQTFQERNAPQLGSNISMPFRAAGFRSPGSYIQNAEGYERGKDKRDQREWRAKEKQINRDRATKGLDPIPMRQRVLQKYFQ